MTRGRPKRSDIPVLIVEGMNSSSPKNQCKVCQRTFRRRKNLNTHLSTHSEKKKYRCDFPTCGKPFHQSSQLKSHIFTHTKEKPFICPAKDCLARYAHTNRICPSHANLKLIKQPETAEEIRNKFYNCAESEVVGAKSWFKGYISKRGSKSHASVKIIHDDFTEGDSKEMSDSAVKIHDDLMEVDIKEGSNNGEKIHDGLMEIVDIKEGSNNREKSSDGVVELNNNAQKLDDTQPKFQDLLLFYSVVNKMRNVPCY